MFDYLVVGAGFAGAVMAERLAEAGGRKVLVVGFGRIGVAILAYFLYSQLLTAARTWVEGGVVPELVGIWWVHGIALCVGVRSLAFSTPAAMSST